MDTKYRCVRTGIINFLNRSIDKKTIPIRIVSLIQVNVFSRWYADFVYE